MRIPLIFALSILGILLLVTGIAARQDQPAVWIGIQMTAEKDIPGPESEPFPLGLRIVGLPYDSPAAKAGVILGDAIVAVDGKELSGELKDLPNDFRTAVIKHKPGDEIALKIMRDAATITAEGEPKFPLAEILRDPYGYLNRQPAGTTLRLNGVHDRRIVDIRVRVERRPAGAGAIKAYSSGDAEKRGFPKTSRTEEQFASALIDAMKIGKGYGDLRERLGRLSAQGDPFRLSRVAYVQNDPFQLRTVANDTASLVFTAASRHDGAALLRHAADWLDAPLPAPLPPLATGLSLDQHLDQLVHALQEAESKRREAFASMSEADRKLIGDNADGLLKTFAATFALSDDPDRERWQRHARVLELSSRIDYKKLFEGAAALWRVADDRYLDDLERAIRKSWEAAGKPEGVFIDRPSPVGRILVGGAGTAWYREDAAILLDLGGNDFFTNNAAASRTGAIPAGLLIDFAGNDSYEATFNWTQGAALLGNSVLIDRKGDDTYVAQDWAQGAALFGAALFLDESGNDVYRGNQFSEGVAAFGIGLHADLGGDDAYEAHFLSQGVGMPGGAGWLVNASGNDRYYAKGTRPTSYGDAGIFDSWSQGCAVGFRGSLSGGSALFLDSAGRDRYEAGNFSQGGGYYFGFGIMHDGGGDNDLYVGSRYNQAFAAHQAVGYFEDEGGDDFYTTRHGVAQSIAWDESIAAFLDRGGNDIYEGGVSFSQGASAHNGFAVFLDLGGKNRFVYGTPQGSAGPNDYHGGESFSLFVAAEDRGNTFTSKMKRSSVTRNGESGIFVDIPESIEEAVARQSWRERLPLQRP